MKTTLMLLATAALSVASASAFGQACTAQTAPTLNQGTTSLPGQNLCAFTDQLVKTCANGTTLATGPDAIYQIQIGSPSSAVITVNGAGFNPYIALMTGASCNSLDTCGSYENLGGPSTNVSLPSTAGLPAGTYYLVISDAQANITCPGATFTVGYTGSLPVQLQQFSID